MSPPTTGSSIRSCPQLRAALAGLAPQPARIPILSTVDGVGATPSFDAEYWVANLRNPVRFGRAVATAGASHTTFIEISPHPLLTYAISDTLGDAHHHALGTLARDTHDTVSFHTALNTTHTLHPPDTDTPTRTPPPPAHHPLAPHPPLDHPQCHHHTAGNTPAAGHRRDRSHQRHADLAKHAES